MFQLQSSPTREITANRSVSLNTTVPYSNSLVERMLDSSPFQVKECPSNLEIVTSFSPDRTVAYPYTTVSTAPTAGACAGEPEVRVDTPLAACITSTMVGVASSPPQLPWDVNPLKRGLIHPPSPQPLEAQNSYRHKS